MNKQKIFDVPLGSAVGAPGHHHFFKADEQTAQSIFEMAEYAKKNGIAALLRREYPDTHAKNIIVNVIGGKHYIADGNRHAVALLIADPELTFGQLEDYCPGLIRLWSAGYEEGCNDPSSPYDVYIPVSVDISRVQGAYVGTDYFKTPPAPTNIVPASLRSDSELLSPNDRGRPLFQTAMVLMNARL